VSTVGIRDGRGILVCVRKALVETLNYCGGNAIGEALGAYGSEWIAGVMAIAEVYRAKRRRGGVPLFLFLRVDVM
jgi:hypothetical protein